MDSRYVEFEDILTEVGSFGKYQKTLILFLIAVGFLSSFQSNTVHLMLTPDHWCSVKELSNFSVGEQHRFIRPVIHPSNCSKEVVRDSCLMFDIDYKEVLKDLRLPPINESAHQKKLPLKPCDNGWLYDRTHYWDSFAMHFDFVCQHKHELNIIGTVRTIASICGTPFFGLIADLYGRRMSYLSILITAVVSSMSPMLCKEYTIFLVCQFIIGLTYPSSHLVILILIMEFMCPKDRAKTISILFVCLQLATISHTIIIYFIPHWIWITVMNTALVLPLIFSLRLIPESLQWLISRSKYDLVEKSFKSIMQTNDKSIDEELLEMQVKKIGKITKNESEETEVKHFETEETEETEEKPKIFKNIVIKFLRETTLFQILLILTLCLAANIKAKQIYETNRFVFYENQILFDQIVWTLIKIPAILITWFLMQRRIGRRLTNALLLMAIGLILVGLIFANSPQTKQLLSSFGVLLSTGSVMATYLQLIELSPTTFRCLTLTSSITIATLVVAVLNYVHTITDYGQHWLYLVVLSAITLLVSFLLVFVVETLRENMPQNIVASEQLLNEMHFWSLGKRKCDMKSNVFKSLSKWDLNEGLDNT